MPRGGGEFLNLPPGVSSPDRAGRIVSFCAAVLGCPLILLLSLHQVAPGPTHSPRYRLWELKKGEVWFENR